MKGFSVKLKKYYFSASNTEKVIINEILKDLAKINGLSIHKLAKMTYSSASTISRLCHNLGYDSYKGFQNALLYEMAFSKELDSQTATESIVENDTIENIINKITYNNIKSLEDSKMILDEGVLIKVVEEMKAAKKIAFLGMGASQLVATDAYLRFLRINKDSLVAENWHTQFIIAQNLTEDDIAIVISYSGKTEEMIKCATEAKLQGAKLVLISGFFETPLSRLADYNLYVASVNYVVGKGAMTSKIAQMNLIDIIFALYVNDDYNNYQKLISKTRLLK